MWSLCRKKGKFLHSWIECCPFALPCNYNKTKSWNTVFNIIRLYNICRMQRESCSHVRNSHVKVFFFGYTAPSGPGPCRYRGFTITLRHTTLGRSSLDDLSAWPYNAQHSALGGDTRPFNWRDSNPPSQQPSGCRPTP